MKRPETRTSSVTYHNKLTHQVSVEYVKEFGGKQPEKAEAGWTDGQRANL